MMNKNMNIILEGLHDNRILEAMSKEDIQKIDVNSIKPEKKDLDRAEGLKVNAKKTHEDGSPWNVLAGKMAKLIKDPMKLVRRSKAVRMTYGDAYDKNKEADVWTPFREALVSMGFTEEQISEIEGVKTNKSVQKKEVRKTVSVDDKPVGWTPFDEGFKSGDKVQIHTDSDGWFGEYEIIRTASDKDFSDLSKNYLRSYSGKKYVVKNIHKGIFFGDLDIITDKNIRKVNESNIDEDEWKTMHGAHILVDSSGSIKAGGPEHLRGKQNSKTKSQSRKTVEAKTRVKAEPYTGKRSGNKELDDKFDKVRDAKAQWDKAKEDKTKAYKAVCKKLGIKATRTSSIYSQENNKKVKAAKDPDFIKATKAEEKAMYNHANTTRDFKKSYKDYRSSGGEQIRDYYSASTEWDDFD